ncbi:MAG: hypothetical protein ACK5TQ_16285 [Acetobacteraceae bacterium]
MPVIPITLITAGFLGNLLLIVLLMGDATAPGRVPLLVAAVLALGGAALMLSGLMMLEPRRRRRDAVGAAQSE